ncbi:hypothetical protein PF011_g18774 [Phytophthora fragariae]|uniref:Uncharacterized protein n=1 Tax=Phytophthora fragariae TaxID=53985 RepID=A0A6A3J7L0_9STRA|nr:hypothetical protein PF011_g18774 [Phytophthora fragariae]
MRRHRSAWYSNGPRGARGGSSASVCAPLRVIAAMTRAAFGSGADSEPTFTFSFWKLTSAKLSGTRMSTPRLACDFINCSGILDTCSR